MLFSDKINQAIRVAACAHEGQYRKGSAIPYIFHPYAVALISQKYYEDEKVFIACLLHDVLEDVPTKVYSRDDMAKDFGADILSIADDVSEPKLIGMKDVWQARKDAYIDHLATVADIRPLIVSTSDKIHNMSEMIREHGERGVQIWDSFYADRAKEIWFYEAVYDVLKEKSLPPVAMEDYAAILAKLEELK